MGLSVFEVEASARMEGLPTTHTFVDCSPFLTIVLCSQVQRDGKVPLMKSQLAVCVTGTTHVAMPFFS